MKSFLRSSQQQLRTQEAHIKSAQRIHCMTHRMGHFSRFIAARFVKEGMTACWVHMPNLTINQANKVMDLAQMVIHDAAHNVQRIRGSVEQLSTVEKEFDKALRNIQSAFRNQHFYVWRMQQVHQLRTAYLYCIERTEVTTEQMEAEAKSFFRRVITQLGKGNVFRIVPDVANWLEDS